MNPKQKWLQVTGLVLNVLIAGLLIFAGSAKIFGLVPMDELKASGLDGKIQLIGWGELVSAMLLLIPRTSPLGTLLVSGFWGGVICMHMTHEKNYIVPSVLLAVTWLGSFLRGSVPLLASKPAAPAE